MAAVICTNLTNNIIFYYFISDSNPFFDDDEFLEDLTIEGYYNFTIFVMAYNLNKSPQPFGGNKGTPPPVGLAPAAPRMSSIPSSADAQLQGPVTRRQLLSPAPHSPQSSPCPSPVARLRPHSIALSGTTTNPLQTDHPAGSTSPSRSQGMYYMILAILLFYK